MKYALKMFKINIGAVYKLRTNVFILIAGKMAITIGQQWSILKNKIK